MAKGTRGNLILITSRLLRGLAPRNDNLFSPFAGGHPPIMVEFETITAQPDEKSYLFRVNGIKVEGSFDEFIALLDTGPPELAEKAGGS